MTGRIINGGTIILSSAPVTAVPLAMLAAVKVNAGAAGTDTIAALWNGTTAAGFALEVADGKARVRARATDGSYVTATAPTAFTPGVWTPVLGLWRAANDIAVYCGSRANSAQATTSITPTGVNKLGLGCRPDPTPINFLDGAMAAFALWNEADFADGEIDALMGWNHPFGVRFHALKAFVPLGLDSPEPDWVAARTFTVTGTTQSAEGPPMADFQLLPSPLEVGDNTVDSLEVAISIGDVEYIASVPLPIVRGRMMAAVIDLDSAGESVGIEIDEGGRTSVAIEGSWNAQSGALIVGGGLSAGAVPDAGAVVLRLATVEAHGDPLTGNARDRVWNRVADALAPQVQDAEFTIPGSGSTTKNLAPFVKDPAGRGWTIDSVTAGAGLSAQIQGQTLKFAPSGGAGSVAVKAVIKNAWKRPRTATMAITETKEAVTVPDSAAHDYFYAPPWLPASSNKLDLGEIDATKGFTLGSYKGAPDRVLLLWAPEEVITGRLNLNDSEYGGIILIGATFRWEPTGSKVTPAGKTVPFGHWCQARIASNSNYSVNPYLYFANIDLRAGSTPQSGDWIQTGCVRTANNRDSWPDIILQKIHIPTGHYYFNAPGDDWDPHHDFIQITDNRGFRRILMANCDIRLSGQGIFAYGTAAQHGKPHPNALVECRDTIWRAMPPDTDVYANGNLPRNQYLIVNSDWPNEYPNLNFVKTRLVNVYGELQSGTDRDNGGFYFAPKGNWNATTKVASWPLKKYPDTADGVIPLEGTVTFKEPTTAVLDTDQCGFAHRITTYDELKAIF